MNIAKAYKWCGVTLLVCVGLALAWTLRPSGPVCPANFNLIQLGMAKDEVRALISRTPSQYGPFCASFCGNSPSYVLLVQSGTAWREPASCFAPDVVGDSWAGERYCIGVAYDGDDKTDGMYLFEVEQPWRRPTPKLVKDVLFWLGW